MLHLVLMVAQKLEHFLLPTYQKVPFSEMEDSFLKQGVLKYGMGKWTSILNDSNYKFHSSRKASTLAVRAKRFYK